MSGGHSYGRGQNIHSHEPSMTIAAPGTHHYGFNHAVLAVRIHSTTTTPPDHRRHSFKLQRCVTHPGRSYSVPSADQPRATADSSGGGHEAVDYRQIRGRFDTDYAALRLRRLHTTRIVMTTIITSWRMIVHSP